MRQGATFSAAFHLTAIAMIALGLPSLTRTPIDSDPPILLDLVPVQEKSQAPTPPLPPAPKQVVKAEPQPQPPPAPVPTPTPDPPKPAEIKPPEKPEPPKDAEPIKKVEEKKKEEPKPPEPPKPAEVKKKPDPPKPDPFTSVLKNVDKLRPTVQQPNQQQAQVPPTPAPPTSSRISDQLARSELDAVRERIRPCWNFPAGAPNPEQLVVEIWAALNPDGTVREARIVDTRRMGDPFYRAAAEAALRAMLNPACQPLPLPREKYNFWKTGVFAFDPQFL